MRYDTETRQVFEFWNKQPNLKKHRKLTPSMKDPIARHLSTGWEVEDLCLAISNFNIANDKEHKWSYPFSLASFFCRGARDNEKGYRWIWFSDEEFNEEEWRVAKDESEQARLAQYEELKSKGLL